jgi:hypothetical protein
MTNDQKADLCAIARGYLGIIAIWCIYLYRGYL